MADAPRRPLRNGAHGYGLVTKTLHWAMVLAILTQFVIGYSPKNTKRDGGWRQIGVRVTHADATARTRTGYFGPTSRR